MGNNSTTPGLAQDIGCRLPLSALSILLAFFWLASTNGFSAAGSWTQGSKTILYMRLAFPDDMSEPISNVDAVAHMNQAEAWFQDHSYNSLTFSTTVTPLLVLPQNKSWYASESPQTLLDHSRTTAADAGHDPFSYDLDIARFKPISGPSWNFSGTSSVGSRNLWLQATHLGLTVHELGHNLGLDHADRWLADDGGIVGPGVNLLYENVFDTMGQPQMDPLPHHFNVVWKNRLDWLPNSAVFEVGSSGLVRLWAYDINGLTEGRFYALRYRASPIRDYWMEFRQGFPADARSQNGLIFNLGPWEESLGNTQLLDMTPESGQGVSDAPLVVGRTFSDWETGMHVTPLGTGTDATDRWIDVQINLGTYADNTPPTISIIPPAASAAMGAPVEFSTSALDPDSDPLAYFWDYGDGTFGTNGPTASHSWILGGDYVVRCTVTDMKGGTAGDSAIVTVGTPGTFRIVGAVLNEGAPLEGVRVRVSDTNTTVTDSDGTFALVGLVAGGYTVAATRSGWNISESGFINPVTVGPENASSIDFAAQMNGPEFQTQPSPKSANVGTDVTFYALVSGAPPLQYQWRLDGADILGANRSVLSVTNVQLADAGAYAVVAWNAVGTNISDSVALTVSGAPVILTQPQDQTVNLGESATFSVEATVGEPFLFYQWYYNTNAIISGARASSYTIPIVTEGNGGTYSVLVVNLDDSSTSSNAFLFVNHPPFPASPVLERLPTRGIKAPVASFLGSDPDGDTLLLETVGPGTVNGGSVLITPNWVKYNPPTGNDADDSFSFLVNDGRGGTAQGTATVIVIPDDIIPDNLRAEILPSGDTQLTFDGIPDRPYSIQYTEQLNPPSWQVLGIATADGTGRFSYTDSPPPDSPARYYRSTYP